MFDSVWEDIKFQFRSGNMLTRIIIVNVGVFVIVHLVGLFSGIFGAEFPSTWFWGNADGFVVAADAKIGFLNEYFSLSADWWTVLKRPWTMISHMFLHKGFFHLLFNMLILYWFGRIVGDLLGDQRILPLYLIGGLAGVFMYLLAATFGGNMIPTGAYALGASAAVMAMVVAAGATAPDYIIRLILIGEVRLKYVVLTLVFLDIIAISTSTNSGGAIAHLGGSLLGYIFVMQLRRGIDITTPVNNLFDWFRSAFKPKEKPQRARPVYQPTATREKRAKANRKMDSSKGQNHEERLDAILAKIKKTGMESLSAEEKEFLLNASKK